MISPILVIFIIIQNQIPDRLSTETPLKIAFFDLDGTITRGDTLLAFIRFCCGKGRVIAGLAALAPVMVLHRLGLIPSGRAKERVLSHFFRGIPDQQFRTLGSRFSRDVLPGMVRERAMDEIRIHQSGGVRVVVVTASLNAWCEAWCRNLGLDLIATEYETNRGIVTGKIVGKNCKGPEKIRRINERFNLEKAVSIYAYGDRKSDRDMLNLAHFKYLKWKRIS